jgi:hypothetical protein
MSILRNLASLLAITQTPPHSLIVNSSVLAFTEQSNSPGSLSSGYKIKDLLQDVRPAATFHARQFLP